MSTSKQADSPADISKTGWIAIAKRVWAEQTNDHVGLIAAGVAFYALLALFPAVTATMAIAGLIAEPDVVAGQIETFTAMMPADAASLLINQVQDVTGSESGGLGLAAIFGILVAIYSASKGVNSLMEGLNVAFDQKEERGFFMLTAMKFGLTFALIVGLVLIAILLAIVPAAIALLPVGETLETWLNYGRWPILLVVVCIGLAFLYRFGPSRAPRGWRWITPGAAIATALWVIGSLAFSFYVANFGSYNETFGALGGVIILLMWLWLSAYIVLIGAEIDAEMERQAKGKVKGERKRAL
ncbi:YihY/virulence factor BrkB family protein [Roseicyclus sp. F158]|uniref:YihY/virulence factor BrkB family protein n=1 Tax=Tropicimonas omnivorans TaxID=3075590 RepID=A0ABU3DIH1_9RHOB|nr:YihY/virulence factor BrkB family protein [Roseicyclus sp. F158]MDT0683516.1 YihY/virulence factor BrkB family protein [Roseicyclus sp. F158]